MKQLAPACTLLVVLFVFPARVNYSRSPEADAIGVLRAVVTAQQVHAARHEGRFSTPACLAAADCVRADTPLLDPSLAALPDRGGYRFTFHPVPATGADEQALAGYALTAHPLEGPGSPHRGFCADATGQMVWSAAETPPAVREGRCGAQ